ncbi:hypothetical protein ACIA58_07080 [Kribbella sp. NPDC051586]|uniref:hypothetical protein n=1 Tax=Kribbella sp. NPDC051586 TaxID=3364118 RepID=UPI00379AE5A6
MWGRRVVATLLASVVVGAGVTGAQAAVDPLLTVSGVTADRSAVAVSGLNTVAVQLQIIGKYNSTDPLNAKIPLVVFLKRISGSGPQKDLISTDLALKPGTTVQNGVWAGPVLVPSTANGTYKVYGVITGPFIAWQFGGTPPDPTPVDGPTITVTGLHQPKITAKVTPPIVPFGPGFTITWAIIDSATGKAYGTRIKALLGLDNQCAEDAGGIDALSTTAGLITHNYPDSAADPLNCLRIRSTPGDIAGLGLFVVRPGVVSATPAKAAAPVGTIVGVNGNVLGPAGFCPVVLQRLYGATQWRGVSTAKTRQSGRFTVSAQPAYKGLIPYRVYLPTCGRFLSGISRVFYIRGL